MKKSLFLVVVMMLVLSACNLLQKPAPTQDVAAALQGTLDVQNAAATVVAQSKPTEAPLAPAATIAPPTEAPVVATTAAPAALTVLATTNVNCRFGPYSNFSLVELLTQGSSAEVIGKNTENGIWYKVKLADGKECWVGGDVVTLSGVDSAIALLISPPTPTKVPPPSWAGDWKMRMSGTGSDVSGSATNFDVTFVQTGNTVSFSYNLWGFHFGGQGTVSADGMTVTGRVSQNAGWSGNFTFVRVPGNLNQFQGKWVYTGTGNDGEYCGYKGGAGFPSPCRP